MQFADQRVRTFLRVRTIPNSVPHRLGKLFVSHPRLRLPSPISITRPSYSPVSHCTRSLNTDFVACAHSTLFLIIAQKGGWEDITYAPANHSLRVGV